MAISGEGSAAILGRGSSDNPFSKRLRVKIVVSPFRAFLKIWKIGTECKNNAPLLLTPKEKLSSEWSASVGTLTTSHDDRLAVTEVAFQDLGGGCSRPSPQGLGDPLLGCQFWGPKNSQCLAPKIEELSPLWLGVGT